MNVLCIPSTQVTVHVRACTSQPAQSHEGKSNAMQADVTNVFGPAPALVDVFILMPHK